MCSIACKNKKEKIKQKASNVRGHQESDTSRGQRSCRNRVVKLGRNVDKAVVEGFALCVHA